MENFLIAHAGALLTLAFLAVKTVRDELKHKSVAADIAALKKGGKELIKEGIEEVVSPPLPPAA